jgi:sec-independent protein translocase protein TatB
MNVFGIGTGELLLILVIVLLVMGPERIPQLARQWGKFVRVVSRFTRTWQEVSAEINRQINLEDMANAKPKPKPSSPPPEPTPEETDNIIAPPEKQVPVVAVGNGETGSPTPAESIGIPTERVFSDTTPANDLETLAPKTEPAHE